ncbi:grpE protein homolog, mitochondrial isoform X2 [Chelonus insularis]|uniref:grpE protein homolog, mitochondrial isoform X2 n=1 Tax=Chelonus insularis TaxID=460826 RepID=UPI00158BFD91|nr:grpE protein homolog, mitochondrial isoform X2 [Chelonus insularis]
MACIALPVVAKLGKLSIENFYHGSRTVIRNSRVAWNYHYQSHKYTTAPEEKKSDAESPELTENEKKFKAEIELLNKEIVTLKEKNSELDDKYKRALADGENLRVRLTKQIEDAKLFGIQGFCKDLLDVADILGKATESVPKDQLTANNPHLKSLYEGLRMTEAQLHKVFKKHGLASVNPLDEKFNPNEHEALFQQISNFFRRLRGKNREPL